MSDEDNYTIIDEPDELADAGVAATLAMSRGRVVPVVLVVLGLIAILAAAWCQTKQEFFFGEDGPDRSSLFVYGLAQPLGIAGALLTVVGICAIAYRIIQAEAAAQRLDVVPPDAAVPDAETVVGSDR